jgi:hypothetical protein
LSTNLLFEKKMARVKDEWNHFEFFHAQHDNQSQCVLFSHEMLDYEQDIWLIYCHNILNLGFESWYEDPWTNKSHCNSQARLVKALYSDSKLDLETIVCFLDFHGRAKKHTIPGDKSSSIGTASPIWISKSCKINERWRWIE